MSEQPQADRPDDSGRARRPHDSRAGAFVGLGSALLVFGLVRLSGDGSGSAVAFLGVGVVFLALAVSRRATRPRTGRPGDG